MDGWQTAFILERPIFECYVSFRECISLIFVKQFPKFFLVWVSMYVFLFCWYFAIVFSLDLPYSFRMCLGVETSTPKIFWKILVRISSFVNGVSVTTHCSLCVHSVSRDKVRFSFLPLPETNIAPGENRPS